jgi:hypothetical protein
MPNPVQPALKICANNPAEGVNGFASVQIRPFSSLENRGKSALGDLWENPYSGWLFGLIDMALQAGGQSGFSPAFATNFTRRKPLSQRHGRC